MAEFYLLVLFIYFCCMQHIKFGTQYLINIYSKQNIDTYKVFYFMNIT